MKGWESWDFSQDSELQTSGEQACAAQGARGGTFHQVGAAGAEPQTLGLPTWHPSCRSAQLALPRKALPLPPASYIAGRGCGDPPRVLPPCPGHLCIGGAVQATVFLDSCPPEGPGWPPLVQVGAGRGAVSDEGSGLQLLPLPPGGMTGFP